MRACQRLFTNEAFVSFDDLQTAVQSNDFGLRLRAANDCSQMKPSYHLTIYKQRCVKRFRASASSSQRLFTNEAFVSFDDLQWAPSNDFGLRLCQRLFTNKAWNHLTIYNWAASNDFGLRLSAQPPPVRAASQRLFTNEAWNHLTIYNWALAVKRFGLRLRAANDCSQMKPGII